MRFNDNAFLPQKFPDQTVYCLADRYFLSFNESEVAFVEIGGCAFDIEGNGFACSF